MSDVTKRLPEVRASVLSPFQSALYGSAAGLAATIVWALFLGQPDYAFTTMLFVEQDVMCGLGIAIVLVAIARFQSSLPQPAGFPLQPAVVTVIITVLAAVIALIGARIVFSRYGLTRDEAMAVFDARIFTSGGLVAFVPAEWRSYVDALEPEFLTRFADGVAWSSVYLPGNAALHALTGLFVDRTWTAPLLVLLAVWATWSSARIMWPAREDAALIAALMVASAPQVVVTGMTSYAMTAHLALDMLWLRLFLQNTRSSHAAAIATGWVASGLHQVVFHPLFVAPFILQMWMVGRRRLAVINGASYLLIGLFWISYGRMIMAAYHLSPADKGSDMLATAAMLISNFSIFGLNTMLKNAIRFITWQNLLLLPLTFLGIRNWRVMPPVVLSLCGGIALTFVAIFVLLPYQGHGWGYRYLHGCIGGFALVAAFGWVSLGERPHSGSRSALFYATAATVLVLLPVRAWQARTFAQPYAQAYELIQSSKVDVVIVDRTGIMFAVDLVRNDPMLQEKPKILDLAALAETQILELCRAYRVAIFDKAAGLAVGIPAYELETEADMKRRAKRNFLGSQGCGEQIKAP